MALGAILADLASECCHAFGAFLCGAQLGFSATGLEQFVPIGPFRTFQVPVRDVAALTGLNLDQLVAADRMPIARALTTAPVTSIWRRLNSPLDLDLDFDLNGTD